VYSATTHTDRLDVPGGPTLEQFLAEVALSSDPGTGEDVAVWNDGRLVAVVKDRGDRPEVVHLP
jgi:hypothetical protein